MEIPGPTYDVVIIGGGPIGLACAIEARRRKLSHIILEKGVLVNSIYHFPVNMTFFSTSNLLEIGDVPFIAHADKPSRREALEYYRRVVESWQLNLHVYEPVTGMYRLDDAHYAVVTGKSTYRGHAVIVATGFYDCANLMEIPGESLPKVKHYYDDPHPYIGQKVVVVGAANSACDVALETYYKGAEVTMVIREAQ
ncbi:MAG TPA: NAD(P)-binding domain-containing protein, partial [Saprospiraceae bacterium]|nr:NAD(P)-binding domain-containing protein [Saprospiraceae bacterium]